MLGLIAYQGIPDLIRFDFIRIRLPNFIYFLIVIFLTGFFCGYFGHLLYIRLNRSLLERALIVGISTGLAIALFGWMLTYSYSEALFPFELFKGLDQRFVDYLRNALIAGPVGGTLVSLAVSGWLHRRGIVMRP